MLRDELLKAIVCPACQGDLKQEVAERVDCLRCGAQYAVERDIPILVPDSRRFLYDMNEKVKDCPSWYEGDQLKYINEGPYRHHLRKRVIYLTAVLSRHKFTNPRILDVGCGDGGNLVFLSTVPGATVFGMDYNMLRLFRARDIGQKQALLVMADVLQNNFRKGHFDIILCNHVLEHIPRDAEALASIHAALKPGGLFILGTPNEGAATWLFNYKVVQPEIMKTTDHVHFYTAKSLQRLVEKSGFAVEEVKRMGWGVPHTTVDGLLRQHKWIDDLFDAGRWICPSQATSLYLVCRG